MSALSLEEFAAEVQRFLDAWPLRPDTGPGFLWGSGSDDVSLFEEVGNSVEQVRLDEVRGWRRCLQREGYSWLTGPPRYGGRGLTREYQVTFDRLARRHQVPGSGPLTISLGMVAPTILAHGTESAKLRYLSAMQGGDLVGCQLFSEPGAGSDLASLCTTAARDGDGWRVSGQKVWTSGAHLADIGEVLCRSSDGARHRNLTAFVIDMHARGVDVRPLRQMTGGSSFNEVFLDDVWVPDVDRLGDVDQGWRVAVTTLTNERSAIGGSGFGGKGILSVERLCSLLHHTNRAADPVARQAFARLVCGLRTAGWTRQRFGEQSMQSEAPILKLAFSRDLQLLSDVVSLCLGQSLSADTGEWGTFAWSSFILGLPGYRIGGGTDEVLKSVLAERVLSLPKEPLNS
jgi:alkylation response protein AidB-like acyl-CoA dehydrogenase